MKKNISKFAAAAFLFGCVCMTSCKSSSQSGCYYSNVDSFEKSTELECPEMVNEAEKTTFVYKKVAVTGE